MLPINFSQSWYNAYALFAFIQTVNSLSWPKRYIAEGNLHITILLEILGSVASSTAFLVQQLHTDNYVNSLKENIISVLITQDRIDRGLRESVL